MTDSERRMIEAACQRLIHAYAYYADFGQFDAAAAQYAEDGSLEIAATIASGRKAIRDRLARKPATQVSRHVCTNTLIDVLGPDRARGITYVTLYRFEGEPHTKAAPLPLNAPFLLGHYEDEFCRTADGWRFAKRKLVTTFKRDA